MQIGMPLPFEAAFHDTVRSLCDYEEAGLDVVLVPEAYSFDSVSMLGYLAARTERVQLCSSILNIYSRTPTLIAMTAAGLDHVSEGRFILGLGSSGPQVVEGFHGVAYDAPLARTREVVAICQQVWRRERVEAHGRFYDIPLTPERGGSGLGKPLKLINHPVRSDIPIMLAALGPRNVALAAELFTSWEPIFFYPERADAAFGEALAAGRAARSPDLAPLQITIDTQVLVTEDADRIATALDGVRHHLALYIGGMGARGQNFYNDLAGRFGFEDEARRIQDLYLNGEKLEAAAAVPDELVRGVSLIGPRSWVAERLQALHAAGVSTVNARPVAAEHAERVDAIRTLKQLGSDVGTTA